ncbi:hypothetical protein Cwoe_0680 [Conexibacter woesei DSM 14684]|uniref:Uncharacterized protein n=1 Tax=Conexibacter woesei (strain DSM 14684 / CCUG 47730 / CIP 108061 / JCM 11494 / NBRC 100937 / ID131577) TaxID=469383 RepID=D3F9E7_CONWI|nr:hypothetical protein Cwoe_0680 [Conexibacter woesei DSM 14684]
MSATAWWCSRSASMLLPLRIVGSQQLGDARCDESVDHVAGDLRWPTIALRRELPLLDEEALEGDPRASVRYTTLGMSIRLPASW